MKQYKCCIFDLDGTLLDTIHALCKSTNLVLEQYGLNQITEAQTKLIVGNGYKTQMERALCMSGDRDLIHYEDALASYLQVFAENCMYQVVPYDGIRELLTFLKEHNVKIAVFSNKPHVRAIENIEGIFGAGYFDAVAGEREGVGKKPDPTGALQIAKDLGYTPEQCLYLGDTNTDMETGHNAGMDTVGVTWGFRDRKELEAYSPKFVLDSPLEIMTIFK